MEKGHWVAIDKRCVAFLPRNRAYTILEALVSYSVDKNNNRSGTIKGYANLWGWSRNKTRRFIDDLESSRGHLGDTKGTHRGHPVRLIINKLGGVEDTLGTLRGHLEDTTNNINNKKEEERLSSAEDDPASLPAKENPTDNPQVKTIINYFYNAVKAAKGFYPVITAGKDSATIKRALQRVGDNKTRLINIIDFYLDHPKSDEIAVTVTAAMSDHTISLYLAEWPRCKAYYGNAEKPPVDKKWWRHE